MILFTLSLSSIDLPYLFGLCAQHTIINAMLLVCKMGENFDWNDVAKKEARRQGSGGSGDNSTDSNDDDSVE